MVPNLAGMFIGWSCKKLMFWGFFSCWSEVHKRNKRHKGVKLGVVCFWSSLKTLGKLKQNLVGMFIGWSYKKFRYFLLIYVHEKNKRPKGFKKGVVCCCIWSVYFSIHLDDISFFMFLMKVSNFFISRGNTVTIKANLPWWPQVNKWLY